MSAAAVDPERVADVLDDAADVIERHGWAQNRYGTNKAGFCVLGALRCVPVAMQLRWAAEDALEDAVVCERSNAVAWNDEPGRTKQEVLDAFRLAAKQQRGRSPA